jgi:quercetin dioxygenase-like cupin family protein
MITRRDILVAAIAIGTTLAAIAAVETAAKPTMHTTLFKWSEMKMETTKTGERRNVFDAPTPTLDRLECHITTLNPGEAPHTPHKHIEEELMFIREGTVEVYTGGTTNRAEAGSLLFCASNEMHGMRNIGTNRASYFVLKIYPHDLPKAPTVAK